MNLSLDSFGDSLNVVVVSATGDTAQSPGLSQFWNKSLPKIQESTMPGMDSKYLIENE